MGKAHEIVKTGMSLAGLFRRFPTDAEAEAWFVEHRWPEGIVCPHCESAGVSVVGSRRPQPYRCRTCRRHFSHMTDTPMHASKLGGQRWLVAGQSGEHQHRGHRGPLRSGAVADGPCQPQGAPRQDHQQAQWRPRPSGRVPGR